MAEQDPEQPVNYAEIKQAALQHVRTQHRETEAAIFARVEMIRAARGFGASWAELADVMEMSRQTAHKRFGQQVD